MTETTKRVDLSDGDWADIALRPTHKQVAAVYAAYQTKKDEPAAYLDLMADVILGLTVAWSVRAEDGTVLALDREGIDAAPFDKSRTVFEAAIAVFNEVRLPGNG